MPSISLNNIVFTGKMNVVPTIKGATFSVSQVDRQTRGVAADLYGVAVAATLDTMVVGSYSANNNAGAASLYTANGSSWTYVSDFLLTAAQQTDTGASPQLGRSVAVSGDWIAVGAPGSGSNLNGIVLLYRRVGGVWQSTAFQQISAANTPGYSGANFGYSVALDGTTLVIGHREANTFGAAHVFVFNGTTWVLQASLAQSGSLRGGNTQRVGWCVTISGNKLLAGGPGANSGVGSGIVLASTRTGSTWSAPATLLPSTQVANDGFGASVAIRGGKSVIGAPGQNSAYIFTGTTQTTQLSVSFSNAGSTFNDPSMVSTATGNTARAGWSVEANADCSVVFSGAPTQTNTAGAVYVFENVGGVWGPSAISNGGVSKLTPNPATANQRLGFGGIVWLSNNEVVVGASGNASSTVGAVYTFK